MKYRVETWRPISDEFPGYEASSEGRIRSLDRFVPYRLPSGRVCRRLRKGVVMSSHPTKKGYLFLHLQKDGRRVAFSVHRAVCAAFHGEPKPGQVVRHLNGDRQDNRACNLRWGTAKENAADSLVHGTRLIGEKTPLALLTSDSAAALRRDVAAGMSVADAAKKYGVSRGTAGNCAAFKTWRHAGGPKTERRGIARGERSGNTRLKEDHVREIRRLHSSGEWTIKALADKFPVGEAGIHKIVHRQTWRHL